MPSVKHIQTGKRGGPIWNMRRKIMGNLVPALVGLPFAVVGVVQVTRTLDATGRGLWWVSASVVLAWLSVNFLGLWDNRRMQREMKRRLIEKDEPLPEAAVFVGCTTPNYAGWLDPHEDVGYLVVEDDKLVFHGDKLELAVLKSETTRIRFRPNVHSLAGLGRWIAVEGVSEGTPIRLLIEPREKRTLLGNLRYSRVLKSRLAAWFAGGAVSESVSE
jgi:hypothetical protein